MSNILADQIAKRFIARRDVKAIQHSTGTWSPHTMYGKRDGERFPWTRTDLEDHISGAQTYGHYLLSQSSQVKLFAFDVDLEKIDETKPERKFYYPDFWDVNDCDHPPVEFDPRLAWRIRAHPSRSWLKYQMKMIAHELLNSITKELEIPCAAAYSGNKGIHIYGFTGLMDAGEARTGAQIVLDSLDHYEPSKGSNFFVDKNDDLYTGFKNFSIEVFPKQSHIEPDSLGNLMRLPLGKNRKSSDPTFFIDMTSPLAVLSPVNPIHALAGNPWKRVGE